MGLTALRASATIHLIIEPPSAARVGVRGLDLTHD